MLASPTEKEQIKNELVNLLGHEREVCRIIIFGSFLTDSMPHDIDIAVFQDGPEAYLPLAMKYRKITRPISCRIPLDIVPLREGAEEGAFLKEITRGEVIYER
jgi:predicted nucleotidyltransferase